MDDIVLHMLSEHFKDLPLPRDYAEFDAGEFVIKSRIEHKPAEAIFIDYLLRARRDKDNQDEIQEYADLVRRYIILIEVIEDGRQLDLHDARLMTDYWTDTKIFDAARRIKGAALYTILEYWQRDKEGGFYTIPEPQRSAAQAGDYGAYIKRLLYADMPQPNRATPEKVNNARADLRPMSSYDQNAIEVRYFKTTAQKVLFIKAADTIYKALKDGECDKDIARKILDLFNVAKQPVTWKSFYAEIAKAYGVDLTFYPPAKLK
ncbi:MAG: hypothetical protein IK073_05715 [Paludibacteraceae bacterium]|nr:hypothetical protein [Paludibacteraceae bacterium]